MKKKIISTITLISLIAAIGSGCVSAKNDNIKVTYDGQTIKFDVEPEIVEDRVMVPMRTIFETFGAKVKWDGSTQTITAKKKSKTIEMTVGNTDMTKNDEIYSFDVSPMIEDGRTLVPIRAISDLLGLEVEWNDSDKTVTITTPSEEEDDSWKENIGTINLDTLETTGSGVSVSDNVITISQGGDFEVTGTLENGQIVIDTEDKAKLRLSGMSLTNPKGAAIYVKNADKAYITLTENTENVLADSDSYMGGDENEKACITSRDSLEIKGNGSLTVNGNYNHGIDCSDSIDIGNGLISITAKNDGIHANDTLAVSGGTVDITAEGDGMQSDEIVDISGGTINITTTGDIPVSSTANRDFGSMKGNIAPQMTDEERQTMHEEMQKQLEAAAEQESSEDITSKGIKAGWMLDISGGDITVNSTDHAVHSASDLNISGGKLTLASESKKGISAHGDIVIDNGEINITKSTEGIETKQIMTINGGNINIASSDDGLNAGGNGMGFGGQRADFGQNGEKMPPPEMPGDQTLRRGGGRMAPLDVPNGEQPPADMQRGGQEAPPEMPGGGRGGNTGSGEISNEHHIQINGGNIYINAQGDGIDSNGSLVIAGGTVIIDGTTMGGNGALDAESMMAVNGGELIAVSTVGMAQAPGSYSTQNVVNITLSESVESGKEITIKDSEGKTIVSHIPAKSFQSFIYSSDKLETGKEYTVYADGGQRENFTVSETITNVGTALNGSFGGGRGQKNNNKG